VRLPRPLLLFLLPTPPRKRKKRASKGWRRLALRQRAENEGEAGAEEGRAGKQAKRQERCV
jgi:hypothetical protein